MPAKVFNSCHLAGAASFSIITIIILLYALVNVFVESVEYTLSIKLKLKVLKVGHESVNR